MGGGFTLGNGQIGAMLFGGVENELIQLNEGTLWSGGPQKRNVNPDAYTYLAPIREALAKEDYQTATQLCRKMQGHYTESFCLWEIYVLSKVSIVKWNLLIM